MDRNGQQFFGRRDIRIGRIAALAVAAATVLGATAACTGSSTGSTSSSGSTSASSTQTPISTNSAGTSSTGGGGSTPSTNGTSTANGGNNGNGNSGSSGVNGGAQSGSNGTGSCTGAAIKVSLGRGGAATGHDGQPLIFTNVGSTTCTLQGYPGAAIMNGASTVLNSARSLNGFIGDERQLSSPPLVTLAPGATASAILEWVVDNGEACEASGSGTLEVTPPNTTVTTGLKAMTAGTSGVCADFQIHPVVAGTLNGE